MDNIIIYIIVDYKLNSEGNAGHIEVTVPNQDQILSVIVKKSFEMKNGLITPLGDTFHGKLCNCTMEPKRMKTFGKWGGMQRMYCLNFLYFRIYSNICYVLVF